MEFLLGRFRQIALVTVGLLFLGSLLVWVSFDAEMRNARAALAGRSQIAATSAGPIEYADVGSGVPLFTIHGAGGLFNTYPSATYAAGQIPGAKLVVFDKGGHLLVGHAAEVRAVIQQFLTNSRR
jgi:pimeloyl-ACP methyl ester carboxylesterase